MYFLIGLLGWFVIIAWGGSAMALLRFIDTDGREQDVADIYGLLDLIQNGRVRYESLVRDDASGRWVKAYDHPLFNRIREIAGQQPVLPPIPTAPPSRAPVVVQAAPVTAPPAGPKAKPKSKWFAAIAATVGPKSNPVNRRLECSARRDDKPRDSDAALI